MQSVDRGRFDAGRERAVQEILADEYADLFPEQFDWQTRIRKLVAQDIPRTNNAFG